MFNPDWRSSPGDTIKDLLEERGLTEKELAKHIVGLQELLDGSIPLTEDIAKSLEGFFQRPDYEFWLQREANFRKP